MPDRPDIIGPFEKPLPPITFLPPYPTAEDSGESGGGHWGPPRQQCDIVTSAIALLVLAVVWVACNLDVPDIAKQMPQTRKVEPVRFNETVPRLPPPPSLASQEEEEVRSVERGVKFDTRDWKGAVAEILDKDPLVKPFKHKISRWTWTQALAYAGDHQSSGWSTPMSEVLFAEYDFDSFVATCIALGLPYQDGDDFRDRMHIWFMIRRLALYRGGENLPFVRGEEYTIRDAKIARATILEPRGLVFDESGYPHAGVEARVHQAWHRFRTLIKEDFEKKAADQELEQIRRDPNRFGGPDR